MSTPSTLPPHQFGSLESVRDRKAVFDYLLTVEQQEGSNQFHLSFLDRGLDQSPNANDVVNYPEWLQQGIDGKTVVALPSPLPLIGSKQPVSFSPPFKPGVIPPIDSTGLNFLHADVSEACLCVGNLINGQMYAHWTGKNALGKAQFWSATKIVPLFQAVSQVNTIASQIKIEDCVIRDSAKQIADLRFEDVAIDIVSYRKDDAANNVFVSNRHAAMMKRLSPLAKQEKWWSDITGNKFLEFRGYYGENPTIANPQVWNSTTLLLDAVPDSERGENLVTAYDLTRLVATAGWHIHLPQAVRLPGAQWHSLASVLRSMGYDSARYIDVAIELMGMQDKIQQPVILSKLGFGASSLRHRTELTFTTLVQFIDGRSKPAVLRSFVLTLRASMQKFKPDGERDLDEEARWIDARIAAEIVEILRRLLTQELA